jgi:hypothetical protein
MAEAKKLIQHFAGVQSVLTGNKVSQGPQKVPTASVPAASVPAGKAVLFDKQGGAHTVNANLVDAYLKDPKYSGWHK